MKSILFIFLVSFSFSTQSYAYYVNYTSNKAPNRSDNFKSNSTSLIKYLPKSGMYNTEVAKVSIPDNLLEITNAKEIFSVNYYDGEKRVSTVLATSTEGKIYDHYKIICNRLNNSSLEDISTVTTKSHQIISSKIKRASGEIEYTLSFSIKMDGIENELFSYWNIDQFPTGNYQNYQIWGSSFSQVISIANFIIDTHTTKNGLISTPKEDVLPNVFVKSGNYSNGILNLNIVNKTNEKVVKFVGNIAQTEISNHLQISNTLNLSGNYEESLTIETGVLFDIGFSLETDSTVQKDALYLADGHWGLDYLEDYTEITNFEINTLEGDYSNEFYEIDRNVKVSGEVKGNINLFRHIVPGDKSFNVSNYESVNFRILNKNSIEVVIMQNEDRAWENRLRYIIPANSEEKEYSISFKDFLDAEGNGVDVTNIKTFVFSVIGDYTNYKPFSFSVNNFSFKSKDDLSTKLYNRIEHKKIINYPNPFSVSTTFILPENSQSIQIQVFDMLGRVVDVQKLDTSIDLKKIKYNAPNIKKGIYKYRVKNDLNKIYSGSFIIK